jgi:hypothetical protein
VSFSLLEKEGMERVDVEREEILETFMLASLVKGDGFEIWKSSELEMAPKFDESNPVVLSASNHGVEDHVKSYDNNGSMGPLVVAALARGVIPNHQILPLQLYIDKEIAQRLPDTMYDGISVGEKWLLQFNGVKNNNFKTRKLNIVDVCAACANLMDISLSDHKMTSYFEPGGELVLVLRSGDTRVPVERYLWLFDGLLKSVEWMRDSLYSALNTSYERTDPRESEHSVQFKNMLVTVFDVDRASQDDMTGSLVKQMYARLVKRLPNSFNRITPDTVAHIMNGLDYGDIQRLCATEKWMHEMCKTERFQRIMLRKEREIQQEFVRDLIMLATIYGVVRIYQPETPSVDEQFDTVWKNTMKNAHKMMSYPEYNAYGIPTGAIQVAGLLPPYTLAQMKVDRWPRAMVFPHDGPIRIVTNVAGILPIGITIARADIWSRSVDPIPNNPNGWGNRVMTTGDFLQRNINLGVFDEENEKQPLRAITADALPAVLKLLVFPRLEKYRKNVIIEVISYEVIHTWNADPMTRKLFYGAVMPNYDTVPEWVQQRIDKMRDITGDLDYYDKSKARASSFGENYRARERLSFKYKQILRQYQPIVKRALPNITQPSLDAYQYYNMIEHLKRSTFYIPDIMTYIFQYVSVPRPAPSGPIKRRREPEPSSTEQSRSTEPPQNIVAVSSNSNDRSSTSSGIPSTTTNAYTTFMDIDLFS